MQARAIFEAAADGDEGDRQDPVEPEIMIPLIATKKELDVIKASIDRVAAEVARESGVAPKYLVGTMIELPRAVLLAGEIAKTAAFFSFGTNDLTQTCFGLSRDDAGSFLGAYLKQGVIEHDPFVTIDRDGVGELMPHRRRARPAHAPQPEARHLRRAWRRSRLGALLPGGRARLCVVLALSRADRAPRRGAGGARQGNRDDGVAATRSRRRRIAHRRSARRAATCSSA